MMFSVKELMRHMICATEVDMIGLKRVVRYLKTMPKVVAQYNWGALVDHLDVFPDSDHAGCFRTRKSIVGGCILWGGKYIKG